ncbi:hypothetical protein [uncultured Arthrobacter sp.]|uniref:hypothetical protein n=1 Tax=uncultured Arthrobacter sp. TaxID=114050 RepID=UPI0032177E9E
MVHDEVGHDGVERIRLKWKGWDSPDEQVCFGRSCAGQRKHLGVGVDGRHACATGGSEGSEGSGATSHVRQLLSCQRAYDVFDRVE